MRFLGKKEVERSNRSVGSKPQGTKLKRKVHILKIEDRLEALEKEVALLKSKKKKTRVNVQVLLDESGSMQSQKSTVISGFNEYVAGLKNDKSGMKYSLTLTKFDTRGNRILFENANINNVELNNNNYDPQGGTPLYDAMADTIHRVREREDTSVFFVIITDGEENSSTRYHKQSIKGLVETKVGKEWQFVYLGANQDAWVEGNAIGINNAFNYSVHRHGANFASASAMTHAHTHSVVSGLSYAETSANIRDTRLKTYRDEETNTAQDTSKTTTT